MSTYYYVVDSKANNVFGNFPQDLVFLVADRPMAHAPIKVMLDGKLQMVRFGFKSNAIGTLYVVSTAEKFVRSIKLFREVLSMGLLSLDSFIAFHDDINRVQTDQTRELIHNLTSLNSYSIQDLFALIPQQTLSQNINKQNETIRDIIAEKPKVTVSTILKQIKYSVAMKVEFSVFEKTMVKYPFIQKMQHSIREIILSILPIFIEEFEESGIDISLGATEKRLNVDYDILFVSLYYILENATKYCCPKCTVKIVFDEEIDAFSISFIMKSVKIDDNEINRLSFHGYRSPHAMKLNKTGSGIGMYRILKTLKLNDATLEIIPRISSFSQERNGSVYESNQFKIKFPGQQDWFKTNL